MAKVRLYAVVPAAKARSHDFTLRATAQDKDGQAVRRETHFAAPGSEHEEEEHD